MLKRRRIFIAVPKGSRLLNGEVDRAIEVFWKLKGNSREEFQKISIIPGKIGCLKLARITRSSSVSIVVSVLLSSQSFCLSPLADRNKKIAIHSIASDPSLIKGMKHNFRMIHKDDDQGRGAAIFVKKHLKLYRGVLIFESSHRYGSIISKSFRETFTNLGGKLNVVIKFPGDESFLKNLTKHLREDPQFVFLSSSPKAAVKLIETLAKHGFKGVLFLSDWASLNLKPPLPIRDVYFTTEYIQGHHETEVSSAFERLYIELFNRPPHFTTALIFDSLLAAHEALQSSEDPEEYLKRTRIDGVCGTFGFKEDGEVDKGVLIAKLEKAPNFAGKVIL